METLIYEALRGEGIQVRPSTSGSRGDQVDGALMLDGRAAIVECKWEKAPISSTTLTHFQSKVDRRLVGTVGFFISSSGYADSSADYLARGHPLNTVLVDFEDLVWSLSPQGSMTEMLRRKLERAAWDGVVYWRDPEFKLALESVRGGGGVIIVTEGPKDEMLLARFIRTVDEVLGRSSPIPVLAAYGVYQANALANAIVDEAPNDTRVIAVVDADELPAVEVRKYWKIHSPKVEVIIAEPTIEAWFQSENLLQIPAVSALYERLFSGLAHPGLDPAVLRRLQREHALGEFSDVSAE